MNEAEKLKAHTWSRADRIPGKLYLHLYHGRIDPTEDLEEWGSVGPYIGPLRSFRMTYMNGIKMVFEDWYCYLGAGSNDEPLRVYEDMILYDNVYYGDFALEICSD